MPVIHIMLSNDIARHQGQSAVEIFRGLYGEMTPGGFVVADEIRPMSPLFNLVGAANAPLACRPDDILALQIDDESLAQALKHHLLMTCSSNWGSLYTMILGQVPAAMRGALGMDEAMTRDAVNRFGQERRLREFDVPITYYAMPSASDELDGADEMKGFALANGLAALMEDMLQGSDRLLNSVRFDSSRSVAAAVEDTEQSTLDSAGAIDEPARQPDPVPQLRAIPLAPAPSAVSRETLRQLVQQRRGGGQGQSRPPELPAWIEEPVGNLSLFVRATARVSAVDEAQAASLVNLLANLPDESLQRSMLPIQNPQVETVEIVNEPVDEDTSSAGLDRPRGG